MLAWGEFCRGKRGAKDVQKFERNLVDNLLALHAELAAGTYRHGGYYQFRINDPKPRVIHKASVKDRLIHHAIYRKLYPFFDRKFIFDSYSCRIGKGTHKAMARFKQFAHRLSQNDTKTVWVLKCDIKKFFDSIDHDILFILLDYVVVDKKIFQILEEVLNSFSATVVRTHNSVGLPLGNLTSQLFVNVYMNEFDQWVKHHLKFKHYIRYADDFVFLSENRAELEELIGPVAEFLRDRLKLELHPKKLFLKTVASGIDFLGWVHFPDHRVLRRAAMRRMMRTMSAKPEPAVLQSYEGLLTHGNGFAIRETLQNLYGLLHDRRNQKPAIGGFLGTGFPPSRE